MEKKKDQPACFFQPHISVNNSRSFSITPNVGKAASSGRVLITPLRAQQPLLPQSNAVIPKVFLKAVSKEKKSHAKTFTLRNVDMVAITTATCLKEIIRAQLKQEIVPDIHDFDVGYVQGTNVISIRSSEDVQEVWSELKTSSKLILWCDGLKDKPQKRELNCESDDELRTTKKRKTKSLEKEDRVQEIVDNLKENHGSKFTIMQLRIWAEMIVGNMHTSTDDPPSTSMFVRAGGQTKKATGLSSPSITKAITDAACAISNVLSPTQNLPAKTHNVSGCSPVRAIENRSKLYKQLNELSNLKSSGVLSDQEYLSEK
ncbi:uncharacterized protein LOC135337959 [Halichondria panicea]|uniref:uncharacterized protein LOC135337959 n=1 Tax=Halichondria panicea TaxID=6063 RepID=UPI00312B4430